MPDTGDRPSGPQDESRHHNGGDELAADVFHGEPAGDGADKAGAAALAETGSLHLQSMAGVSHGERAGLPADPAGAPAPRKAGPFQPFEAAADGQPPNPLLAPITTPSLPPLLKEFATEAEISERELLTRVIKIAYLLLCSRTRQPGHDRG